MRNIVYVTSTLKRSGPINQLFNLIKHLNRVEYNPIVITLSPEEADSRWFDFIDLEIQVVSLNLSRRNSIFFGIRKLASTLSVSEADLIHTNGLRSDVFASCIKKKIPHVTTIHNFPDQDYPMAYGRVLGNVMLRVHLAALKNVDQLIGCSFSVARHCRKKFGLTKTGFIYNGVDVIEKDAIRSSYCKVKRALSLKSEAKVFIATGHLAPIKDPIFLIRAWFKVLNNFPNCHLVFLGSGILAEKCRNYASSNPNVHFLGRVNNVGPYLSGADYFVSASKSEGFGLATAEAMACGLPVLLSDIVTHNEFFKLNSGIGEIFKLGDVESFMGALKKLLRSDYELYQNAVSCMVKESFSAVKSSEEYGKIYRRLLTKTQFKC